LGGKRNGQKWNFVNVMDQGEVLRSVSPPKAAIVGLAKTGKRNGKRGRRAV